MNDDIISKSKILIVDDQPTNLSILFDYLDRHKGKVFLAQNGQKALELAESKKPDIIVLDIIMPGMDGYEVCKRLKSLENTREIPVIFMSALTETEHIVKGFEAGGVDYIIKPVQYQEAMARISTHLKIRYMEMERRQIEERLRNAEKIESLNVMAGGIAHNFNNILSKALGYAELTFMSMPHDTTERKNIKKIIDSINRAADMTKEIITYTGANLFTLSMEHVNMSRIVKEMQEVIGNTVPVHHKVIYDLSENLPSINGDVSQISRLIKNLITNASEAIGNNEGTIIVKTGITECDREYLSSVNTLHEPEEGLYVYLHIEDTGCGIGEDIRDKIFEPFFTTKFLGRGLGLSVVQGIVRIHRGLIKVRTGENTIIETLFPSLPAY
ncbi:MAG: response regulator [Candidatus Eremiobacterota bacterium]